MTKETQIAVGKRIRALRGKYHMSQETLSSAAGVERSYIAKVEAGKKNVSLDVLERLSDAFGIPLSDLFTGVQGSYADSAPAGLAPRDPASKGFDYASVSIENERSFRPKPISTSQGPSLRSR